MLASFMTEKLDVLYLFICMYCIIFMIYTCPYCRVIRVTDAMLKMKLKNHILVAKNSGITFYLGSEKLRSRIVEVV